MHTQAEIEEQLSQAATRMREVSKAAKDQANRGGEEPTDVPQAPLGDAIDAPNVVGKVQGQNLP